MIVLSRQRDQKLFICDAAGAVLAALSVCDIRPDRVRLGVESPLAVHRQEVYDNLVAEAAGDGARLARLVNAFKEARK